VMMRAAPGLVFTLLTTAQNRLSGEKKANILNIVCFFMQITFLSFCSVHSNISGMDDAKEHQFDVGRVYTSTQEVSEYGMLLKSVREGFDYTPSEKKEMYIPITSFCRLCFMSKEYYTFPAKPEGAKLMLRADACNWLQDFAYNQIG
jgi:hypothetical protein